MPKKKKDFRLMFTGMVADDLYSKGENTRCYLCKRYEGQETLALLYGRGVSLAKLQVDMYVDKDENSEFRYPLCIECSRLLGRYNDMERYSKKRISAKRQKR